MKKRKFGEIYADALQARIIANAGDLREHIRGCPGCRVRQRCDDFAFYRDAVEQADRNWREKTAGRPK